MTDSLAMPESVLHSIVTAIVDKPDEVIIHRSTDDMGVLLSLGVAKSDMGKVVGKAGNMARSIRTILRVIGMKQNARVNLKIIEPATPHDPA